MDRVLEHEPSADQGQASEGIRSALQIPITATNWSFCSILFTTQGKGSEVHVSTLQQDLPGTYLIELSRF